MASLNSTNLLKIYIDSLNSDIASLNNDGSQNKNDINTLKTIVQNLSSDNTANKSKIESLKNHIIFFKTQPTNQK